MKSAGLLSILLFICTLSCERGTVPERIYIDYLKEGGIFELPVSGASGYAAISLSLHDAASKTSNVLDTLRAGQGFTILKEENEWWYIDVNKKTGWVTNTVCLINLPDIIPSIVYDNTNTYASLFRSSGIDIPNVTGMALYQAKDFNNRLGRVEYIIPVLYGTAKKINVAQQSALADGNTLIIYEGFRPHDAHQAVYDNFMNLVNTDSTVRAGIADRSFTLGWFLAPSPYNHQRGTAIDVSLGKINQQEIRTMGRYRYSQITKYTEYTMQSAMHELSPLSAIYNAGVNSRSETAWRDAVFLDIVTAETMLLHGYCTGAGFTPLASEWWHFNDLENTSLARDMKITGRYSIDTSYSMEMNSTE